MANTRLPIEQMDQQSTRDGKHNLTRIDTPVSTPPPTPAPATAAAQELYHEISSIYQQLGSLQSLAPCDLVNAQLTRLVTLCIQPYSSEVVDQFYRINTAATLCQNLQNLCATAEGELERHWAHKILQDAGPHAGTSTKHFTYLNSLTLLQIPPRPAPSSPLSLITETTSPCLTSKPYSSPRSSPTLPPTSRSSAPGHSR